MLCFVVAFSFFLFVYLLDLVSYVPQIDLFMYCFTVQMHRQYRSSFVINRFCCLNSLFMLEYLSSVELFYFSFQIIIYLYDIYNFVTPLSFSFFRFKLTSGIWKAT